MNAFVNREPRRANRNKSPTILGLLSLFILCMHDAVLLRTLLKVRTVRIIMQPNPVCKGTNLLVLTAFASKHGKLCWKYLA